MRNDPTEGRINAEHDTNYIGFYLARWPAELPFKRSVLAANGAAMLPLAADAPIITDRGGYGLGRSKGYEE